MSDDHANKAISSYGDSLIETPHLDRLAAEGIRFNNCFVTNSICTPSRACILTGQYGHKTGVTRWQGLDNRPQITFPKLLRENGYYTAVVGKWHLHCEPKAFDDYIVLPGQGSYFDPMFETTESGWDGEDDTGRKIKGYVTDVITDLSLELLDNRPKDRPFCMLLHHKAPHDYWEYDPKLASLFENETIPEPDTLLKEFDHQEVLKHVTCKMGMEDCSFEDETFHDQFKEARAKLRTIEDQKERFRFAYQHYIKAYLRCVRSIDNGIGRVLDYLDQNGLSQNTLVIYTSDQGYFLGEHALFDKRLMYEPSLRTPLLVRLPGTTKAGSVNSDMVLNLDFAQTILDVAGVDAPEQMQGKSLKPLLQGGKVADWRDSMYYHFYDNGHFRIPAHLGVRTDRYKLICFYGDGRREGNLRPGRDVIWELYDIQQDPQEIKNLYPDPSYDSVIQELRAELARLQKQYDDTRAPQVNRTTEAVRVEYEDRSGAGGEEEDDWGERDAEASLEPMAFEDLPEAVRRQARREFPKQGLMGVEIQRGDGRVLYHVMFEVDGTEAGLKMDPRGEILDTWHFREATSQPTYADIEYGPHDRNVLDLWLASSEQSTPLLICIHGGGFSGGDKSGFHREDDLIQPMLEAGISVAAINYRLTEDGQNAYPIPMQDGARAIQYLRRHADEYNLDKSRFGAIGGSAGGCMLMWLGFHSDLSQPDHEDPVLRESSRLQVLAPSAGQSCLHLPTLEKWFGVASLTEHPAYRPLFGLAADGPIEWTDRFDAAMRDASPITHLTADDPPIYLRYEENRPVNDSSSPNIWVHHRMMGTRLKEAMDALGLECHVEYPGGAPIAEYSSQNEFIIRKLTIPPDEDE